MVTFSFVIITTLFFCLLAIIDAFFYNVSFYDALYWFVIDTTSRRAITIAFMLIGFLSCFVIDYRLKNK